MADLQTVRDSIARTLWLSAYADAIDAARERVRASDDDASHGLADALESLPAARGGEDWDDVVPAGFPAKCGAWADRLLARMDMRVCVGAAVGEWMAKTGYDEERLGHCIALQALGHGVTVEDDAPSGVRFDALDNAIPHVEVLAEVMAGGTVEVIHAS